ncbi:MAG: hypothetical protein ACFFBC_12665 [Promethearchaeota archaeon]
MNNYKTMKQEEKLILFENIVQDFQKEMLQYNHPDNPKFNKFNKLFNDLVIEANIFKEQGKIDESIRKYKKAISYSSTIIHIHKSIEHRKEKPQYYKKKKGFWLISIVILIIIFVVMALGIFLSLNLSWVVDILLIDLLSMMILGVYIFLKSAK